MINDMLLWSGLLTMPVRLDNGTLATVIALTEILMPYAIISILSNLGRLNIEIEQAAALLGATPLQVFRRVILPLLLPGLMTAALLVFCACCQFPCHSPAHGRRTGICASH